MKIKICGLSRRCDIQYVNEAKPDYIGFVFAQSPRQVSYEEAQSLRKELAQSVIPVGVFVDAPIEDIAMLYEQGIISMAQLHGQETEAYLQCLKKQCSIPIIKAIGVKSRKDILIWQASVADYLLLDHMGGGTGNRFDWDLIHPCKKPFFLAGGIHSGVVAQAGELLPYALDVSSGVESEGKKERKKILEMVKKVREEGE